MGPENRRIFLRVMKECGRWEDGWCLNKKQGGVAVERDSLCSIIWEQEEIMKQSAATATAPR